MWDRHLEQSRRYYTRRGLSRPPQNVSPLLDPHLEEDGGVEAELLVHRVLLGQPAQPSRDCSKYLLDTKVEFVYLIHMRTKERHNMRDWAIITFIAIILIAAVFAASEYGERTYENWHTTSTTEVTE